MHPRLRWLGTGVATAVLVALSLPAGASARPAPQQFGPTFRQNNLVSDQPGHAAMTDPNLVNAWGMSHGPSTPLWVSDNGADVSTIYSGGTSTQPISISPLVVSTPGGAPTGQVYNDTSGFIVPGTGKPALFIFAGENGDLSAWNPSASPITSAVSVGHTAGAVYKGLALVHSPFGPLLLATNFHDNRIDVFDGSFTRLDVPRLFRDPQIPSGFAPFNVAEMGSRVLVTYAKQDADRHDDVAGHGNGFIDVYTNYGVLLHRLVSHGDLNSPWGLAIAPPSFGPIAGKLLVGNFGDGMIHVYDPFFGTEITTLEGPNTHRSSSTGSGACWSATPPPEAGARCGSAPDPTARRTDCWGRSQRRESP